jgi:glycosyltransferase involved in cell wall biosynthesis
MTIVPTVLPKETRFPPFSVVIPALNEEPVIGSTLESLSGCGAMQIIVVDNGSTDRTAQVARGYGALVIHEPRRGYGQACLSGIAALDKRVEVVVFLDADGSDDPADLPKLLEPIARARADLVIGSRLLGEREPGALTPHQQWGNRLATSLLRRVHGARYTDLGPFRAIRKEALASLEMCDPDFGWTIEMQIKAHKRGLRILEVPVHYRRRRQGESKISGTVAGTVRAGSKILWSVFKYR